MVICEATQMIQTDFLLDVDSKLLKNEVEKLNENIHNLQKILYTTHNEIFKIYIEFLSKKKHLERHICQCHYADTQVLDREI